jgi:hypothetical protein
MIGLQSPFAAYNWLRYRLGRNELTAAFRPFSAGSPIDTGQPMAASIEEESCRQSPARKQE